MYVREKESTSDDIYMTFLKSEKGDYMVLVQYELLVMLVNIYAFQWLHGAISRWILNVL